ncbi:MAG TPA: peptidoglycan-associated lipoprotein Pal [Stellaceae bacterium]|nr:peptidoglycan-associated lipoprotein Pal [Stellaceae bacterium]
MRVSQWLLALCVAGSVAACSSDNNGQTASGANGAGDNGVTSSQLNGMGGDLQSETTELKTQVGDTIHFGYDSSEISGEARQTLQRQAAFAQKYANLTFTIEGHCDERGTREYNLALGERRATSAKQALISLGVSPQRLQTISYGKERPVAVGSTDAAWAQNRRAVTIIN